MHVSPSGDTTRDPRRELMFSMLTASLTNLTSEQEELLKELLEVRKDLHERSAKLAEMQLHFLNLTQGPVESIGDFDRRRSAAEVMINDYSEEHISPLREKQTLLMYKLADEAVDEDKIRMMLPMMLTPLTTSVNLPLLMTAFDVDPAHIAKAVGKAKEFFSSGMDGM